MIPGDPCLSTGNSYANPLGTGTNAERPGQLARGVLWESTDLLTFSLRLLYGDALGQVAWLVYVVPLGRGEFQGEDLQRHRG